MTLKSRAITALVLSIILLAFAVLLWANQTGRITIWGAGGGVVTFQDLGWQNTPTTPNTTNYPTTCPGNSVVTGISTMNTIGVSTVYGKAILRCGNVLVDGKIATKQQHGQISGTYHPDTSAPGKSYSDMLCPTGTFMDSFYSGTSTSLDTSVSRPSFVTTMPVTTITPATSPKINCVTLTETSSNWSVSPATSFTDLVLTKGQYDPVNLYPGAKCVNTTAIGYKWMTNPLSSGFINGELPYFLRCSGYVFASGGPAPAPAPAPTVTVTPSAQDTTPPSAPSNLTAEALSQTEIQLNWTAAKDNVGIKGYKIYNADTNELIATTTQLSYKITGATCKTIYRYFIVAYDANGNHSSRSNVAEATTMACDPTEDTEKPTAPTNLKYYNLNTTGTAPDCWTVELSWNESTDNIAVTGYDIYNADNNKLITTSDTIGHKLTGLKENTKYSYYVKAHDGAKNISDSSNIISFNTSACPSETKPQAQAATAAISGLVSTGGTLWFNILVAILISGIATYFLLKKT